MFVRKTKKPNDRVSLRIVENYREGKKVKQRTITGVGTAQKDDIKKIESLTRVANEMIIKLQNDLRPALPGLVENIYTPVKRNPKTTVTIENLFEEKRITTGTEEVFAQVFKQMNLLDSIDTGYKRDESNELFKKCVIERISNPVSKKKSVENLKITKEQIVDLDKVYRMMDKVFENEDRIKKKISDITVELFKQKVNVAFFDVTTLYFESFTPDTLRASGFSKDGKFKETQVMLSLITTVDGLPLGYELFPGNSYEGNTLLTVIEQVQKNYDLSETFIVADRAMFTKNNLNKLDEKNVKFIVAAKLKTMKKSEKEPILNDIANALKKNPDLELLVKEYSYEERRLIVSYSKKRANKDRKDRDRLISRIEKKMKDGKVVIADLINNTGTKKYLKIERKGAKEATLNKDKILEHERWDGIHAVITNDNVGKFTSDQILSRYRDLWQIEAAFRLNKHDLKMRPIYHWTEKRIRAHILICFVAYSLVAFGKYQLKKHKIKLSFQKVREELERVQYSVLQDKISRQRFLVPSETTPNQKKIFKAFGLKMANKAKVLTD